jgi:hypothetical protein
VQFGWPKRRRAAKALAARGVRAKLRNMARAGWFVALGMSLGLVLGCGGRASDGDMDASLVPPSMPEPPSRPRPPRVRPPPGVMPSMGGMGGASFEEPPVDPCSDGLRDGDETDTDCGGPVCYPCYPNSICQADRDCRAGTCDAGYCRDASCYDGMKNGSEAEVDCGGECNACPPRLSDCPCASSAVLAPLACGGQRGGRAHATSDTILFSLCEGNPDSNGAGPGRCDLARWTLGGGSEVLIGGPGA